MTLKEKAIELVYKYQYLVKTWDCYNDEPLELKYKLPEMKLCALIAVERNILMFTELVNKMDDFSNESRQVIYQLIENEEKVKQEIENL